ncbi:uncharacterized protein LOC133797310 [Humulus lupulus]|uniref:uncharacterized protein LOC133797310 n=1 Tax=Humulus lupulus TaxID=3486 RepID=UPI002B4024D3|nr:uncharacterized protein LOC133797310 [Humulus lupulus]
MRVLRSREIVSVETTPKTKTKTQKTRQKHSLEPSTPAQNKEPSALSSSRSPNTDPPSNSPAVSMGSGPDSASLSGSMRRRSLRLASKTAEPDEVLGQNPAEGGPRRSGDSGEDVQVSKGNEEAVDDGVLGIAVNNERDFTLFGKKFRVFENGDEDRGPGESLDEHGLGSGSGNSGKRKLGIDINSMPSECAEDGEGRKGFLNLRSGKKVAKKGVEGVDKEREVIDLGDFGEDSPERGEKQKGELANHGVLSNCVDLDVLDLERDIGSFDVNVVEGGSAESINEREMVGGNRKGKRKMSFGCEEGGNVIENLEEAPIAIGNDTHHGRRRFSSKEKGKGKLVEDPMVANINSDDKMGLELGLGLGLEVEMESEVKISVNSVVSNAISTEENVVSDAILPVDNVEVSNAISFLANVAIAEGEARNSNTRVINNSTRYMERFRDIAKQNATRFALFDREEEENDEIPAEDVDETDFEDWPGPFSTALKIIKDRERRNLPAGSSLSVGSKPAQLVWTPKKSEERELLKRRVPSLTELSSMCLAKNADSIVSLEIIPDWLKHRMSKLLCDSRRMDGQFFRLLVQGSPMEVRLRDCSWLTEEEFTKSLENFDPSNLVVLQLDQCGRCLPDYILVSTLAQSANNLPALITLSLRGACRLSDVGLKSLVSSAPALRSLNISQCSLLTSSSIDTLANSLGSILRELYLDDCQGIDAMLMLPALKKLEQLEVLSLAGVENVCDKFILEFIGSRGYNMKELILTDCVKVTDSSLKIIAETCSGLLSIDLRNLCKLTDSSLVYLANGCRTIQRLRLCRNSFSDKSIAAFLESSGECLEELSLNNIKKVGCHTALSIGRRLRKLNSLDLSWCRNLTDNELGFIVDSCLSLRVLKLFGCTQITDVFLDGHSNPDVQIIGLRMSPVLDNDLWANPYAAPLRYSSVPSFYL